MLLFKLSNISWHDFVGLFLLYICSTPSFMHCCLNSDHMPGPVPGGRAHSEQLSLAWWVGQGWIGKVNKLFNISGMALFWGKGGERERGQGAPLGGLTRIITSLYLENIPSVEWVVLNSKQKKVCVECPENIEETSEVIRHKACRQVTAGRL